MPKQQIPAEVTPEVSALVEQAQSSALQVREFSIATAADYEAADTALRTLKERKKTVKEKWDYLAEPHKEAEKRLRDFFKPVIDETDSAIRACDQTMTGYRRLQAQIAADEQRRQQEELDKIRRKAEEEAAAARAAAEAKERELHRKADEAREAGKAAQAAKYEQRAVSVAEAGESKAAALQTAAESMPAARVEAQVPKIAGSFGRKTWKARERQSTVDHPNGQRKLTSVEVLILAAGEDIVMGGQQNLALLLNADMPGMNKRATSLQTHFNIPGYEAYSEESTVSRRK